MSSEQANVRLAALETEATTADDAVRAIVARIKEIRHFHANQKNSETSNEEFESAMAALPALQSLGKQQAEQKERSRIAHALANASRAFLLRHEVADYEDESVAVSNGDLSVAIGEQRATIESLQSEQAALRKALKPMSEIDGDVRSVIEHMKDHARKMLSDPTPRGLDQLRQVPVTRFDAVSLVALTRPEVLAKEMRSWVEDARRGSDAKIVGTLERDTRMDEIESLLLAAERKEVALIRDAALVGLSVPYRANTSPQALLGCRITKVKPTSAVLMPPPKAA
jgi:hypothetical protein